MSHALKGPLQTVLGVADLLVEGRFGPLEEGQRDAMDRLIRRGEELDRRVEAVVALLDLETRDPGRVGDGPADASLLLARARERMAARAPEPASTVGVELAGESPSLAGDPGPLLLLFEATLRFLLYDAGDGDAVGAVRVRVEGPEAGRVRFEAAREGGLPGGEPPAAGTTVRLEMLVARRVVEAHGGELRVERDDRGEAVRVVFTLPVSEGADD